MARPTERIEALVLSATKLRETDLILTLLGSQGEQVRAVAHGVRKPGSKFGARLEPFSLVDILVRPGKSLGTISEVKTIESFTRLRTDLQFSAPATAICEIAQKLSYQDVLEPVAFEMTKAALYALDALALARAQVQTEVQTQAGEAESSCLETHVLLLVAAYGIKVAAQHGYMPCLDCCVLCGEPLSGEQVRFSPHAGGAVCLSCASSLQGAKLLDTNVMSWLSTLLYSTYADVVTLECDESVARLILSVVQSWVVEYSGSRIKTLEFLLEIM